MYVTHFFIFKQILFHLLTVRKKGGNMSLVRERTEAKELKMSQPLVMTREEWLERGGVYHGTLGEASNNDYYTARVCENLQQAVTDEEMKLCKDFAMFQTCYADNCLGAKPNRKRPCLPVFYRQTEKTRKE